MVEVVRFASLPRRRWEELLTRSPQRTVFHTPEWISLWELVYPNARSLAILVWRGGGIRAGLPVVQFRRGPFLSFYSLPYGTYGGPIHPEGNAGLVEVLLEAFASLKGFGERIVADFYGECAPLTRLGFRGDLSATQILDLSEPVEKIWQGLSPAKQRLVRQAERAGVEVKEVSPEEIDLCYQMDEDTAHRHRCRPRFHPIFYRHLYNQLNPAGILYWVVACRQGRPLAHQINLCYEGELFYWQGGSFRSGLIYRPNDCLIWHTIRWGCERGVRRYNLGASPTPGVARFKEGWGARRVSYSVYQRSFLPFVILKSLRRG